MRENIRTVAAFVAIVRDIAITALVAAIVVALGQWTAEVHRIQHQPAIVQPAPPLPADRCGGGVC